ncbi:LacI family DNA-binding transcriptional regulator [Candidatus Sumerlaeota bacterium]|nr:LacI family DNA-binding transcriptional regulator [Candidatus Sumerlaeota bacterium]
MIAERAGVARATVSFILNGCHRERGISEKTAQRVREIANALHFIPNETARSLSRRRTGMIGVILPGFKSAWGEAIMTGIRGGLCGTQGLVPLIASQHGEEDWEERETRFLMEREVEAIVCCPNLKMENYRRIKGRGVPVVFIGHRGKGMPDASFVAWDGARVAAVATRHLIAKGRRRIAFLGCGADNSTSSECYHGFRHAIADAGLELPADWRIDVPGSSEATGLVRAVFSARNRPDALISDTWLHALRAMEDIDVVGLKMPEDVALLALGDDAICAHRRIQLSAVAEPGELLGRMAAEIALSLMANPSQKPIQKLVDDHEIFDRGTT